MRPRLGQNFLQDANIARKMVRHARAMSPVSQVCDEIGAGRGALTKYLLEAGYRVQAIEIDTELATTLADRFPASHLQVTNTDVRNWQPTETTEKRLCIGNIPYCLTTAILLWFKKNRQRYRHGMFMVQKEVAERLVALPSTKSYGRISVLMQLFFQVKKLFVVSRTCFNPVPKVDSAVISLTPRLSFTLDSAEEQRFARFTHLLFHTRRKTLSKIVKLHNLTLPIVCDNPAYLKQRPEELSPAKIYELFTQGRDTGMIS